MIAVMFSAAVLLPREGRNQSGRVHQHLTARRDTGCECGGGQLCTHLPLVMIDTKGQEIPGLPTGERDWFGQALYTKAEDGSPAVGVSIAVVDGREKNNHPTDKPDFETNCQIHIHGNSSRRFSKLSYGLRFMDEEGDNRKIPVMGMAAHHEWVLNGPVLDKTLLRNYMWYNIAGEIMDYAPNVRFCELMINGEYQGVYLMTENITNGGEERLNLSINVKGAEGIGYLLRWDRPTEAELQSVRDIYAYSERICQTRQDIAIRYPGADKLTKEVAKNIELDYSAFEKALFSYDYNTEAYGYRNWIDVDNFVDYFLINEFTKNLDAGSYSTYLYKEVGEKFRLCVWDFNNACDNYQEQETGLEGFSMVDRAWFFMLFKDEAFVRQVLKRYEQLRETFFSEEYLSNYVDETIAYLGPAVSRNNERWNVKWEGLVPAERNLHSYEEAAEQLKNWMQGRGEWLDEYIHTLKQYSHPSRNKVYNP